MKLTVINTGQIPIEQPIVTPAGVAASVIVNPGKIVLPENTDIRESVSTKITIKDENNQIYVPGSKQTEGDEALQSEDLAVAKGKGR